MVNGINSSYELVAKKIKEITHKEPINIKWSHLKWDDWYRGNVDGFHSYRYEHNGVYLDYFKKSLQMPKQVCEDWADLLANERTDIVLPDKVSKDGVSLTHNNDILKSILQENNFKVELSNGVEKAFAIGYGAIIENVYDLLIGENTGVLNKKIAKVSIELIDRNKIIPITIINRRIIECAFWTETDEFILLAIHHKNEKGNYIINNFQFRKKDGELVNMFMFDTKSNKKWFQIIRPNLNPNSFDSMEVGVSVFANALDAFKLCDDAFDGLDNEIVLSRKKVFIAADAWKTVPAVNGGQKRIRTFDPMNSLFFALPPADKGGTESLIKNYADEIRSQAYIDTINMALNVISKKCGFGTGYYKFEKGTVVTATQVISENSDLYKTLCKHEKLLKDALINMVDVIIYANNEFTENEKFTDIDINDINVNFDDSIIQDKDSQMQNDRLDVSSGLMSRSEYREKYYFEDETTANESVRNKLTSSLINDYKDAVISGVMTPKQFVDKVYGEDVQNHDEIVEYITNQLSGSSPDITDFYNQDETSKGKKDEDDAPQPEE